MARLIASFSCITSTVDGTVFRQPCVLDFRRSLHELPRSISEANSEMAQLAAQEGAIAALDAASPVSGSAGQGTAGP